MTKEELKEKYPELFKNCFDFSIGKGWMPMILALCEKISLDVSRQHETLINYEKWSTEIDKPNVELWKRRLPQQKEIVKQLEEFPPSFSQIKEKFGGLRAYLHGGLDKYYEWCSYAESLSYYICEDCGVAAEVRTEGWIRTLCLECAKAMKFHDTHIEWKDITIDEG